MNPIRLSIGRSGFISTIFVALFLLLLSASCGPSAATNPVVNDALPGTPVHGPEGHTWHHPDGQLTAIINGTANFPGRTMPSFGDKLTDAEIVSVLEYIKSGWTPEQKKSQSDISTR